MSMRRWDESEGSPSPLGVSWVEEEQAYNFALYSKHATGVTLLLYAADDVVTPANQYHLNYLTNKSGRIWHCRIPASQLRDTAYYAYEVEGPFEPAEGQRFDPEKILLDPYAKGVFFPQGFDREAARESGSNAGRAPLGVLHHQRQFEWGQDRSPRHTHETVIYEMHVKGLTMRASSGVSPNKRGTFAGVIEKIPYLKELGVTVVELLPVHQFDPQEGNYWGYMSLNFFSPHHTYASHAAVGEQVQEFRAMVKALHAADIEVWLDVAYNHTTEGNQNGPTYSYRGIDNTTYYLLEQDRRWYRNDTGTGNVVHTANRYVRRTIVESLLYWTEEMHVDGFRFDLASLFTRNTDGSINLDDPPIIAEISGLAELKKIRLVAEAWDLASYQLGRSFPGLNWLQWNGKFRDDVRSFMRGDRGAVPSLMTRLYGSDDFFPDQLVHAYHAYQSVNFVTCHDGFSLYDLVAYNNKHNWLNGHQNQDGRDDNHSWNCGCEGDHGVPADVMALRKRQIKNFCCLLFLSNGTPMFCAGDEFMNTQGGNNNPYNQDNETTWLNWDLLQRNQDIFRFFTRMIAFRKAHPSLGRSRFWREDVHWYGVGPDVDLSHDSHSLAFYLSGASQQDDDLYIMINGYWEDLSFTVQEGQASDWRRVIDTSLASPEEFCEWGQEEQLRSMIYEVRPRSIVVLVRRMQ
ncbi:MAG: isoamylase [Nitrospira sp.]|nr:isoamylase [Nitrospira sp.]MDH4368472.1 isoamylase [Nitrospira sp.]MDH5347079.1 isoamylase [Nitrospira sp.]MDH5496136.1 isoamylase [Nitrospira sp.]MDH5725652.1 isoamylase [Nitrospira sp.]